jgi:hypothetical protein
VEGKLAVDGQTWKFNRKFHLGQEEIVPAGPYIVSMTFTYPENGYRAKYKIEEKKAASLVLITKGDEDDIVIGKSRDIFARGETGQPNSIITVQLKEIP